ncbi:MAG: LD-carboxypeptidase [Acidimicrobiia bacterium]|nr:LD-carboxypeptidase [Acidimicrobiia bacterium]
MVETVLPRRLQPGDTVAVVAPAGPVTPQRVEPGFELLRSWDLHPVAGEHLHAAHGYLAGDDGRRLADLQAALDDPDVRGVVAARGGYGTQRIVDELDLAALGGDPKPVLGFSDLTALHLTIRRRIGLVTFHGPGAAWDRDRLGGGPGAQLRAMLMDPEPPGVIGPGLEPVVAGVAEGPLVGGNLALLTASIGTVDQPDLAGAVVFLEDVGEPAYRLDRMLTHLLRAGMLDDVAGIVLGDTEVAGEGPSFAEIAAERLSGLDVPVRAGLPAGHGRGQLTLPLGARVRLDDVLTVPDRVTDG